MLNEHKEKNGCCKCGESAPVCLEFHHMDFNEKDFGLDVHSASKHSCEKIMKEIAKCMVLCSNCHKKEHAKNGKQGYIEMQSKTFNITINTSQLQLSF